MVIHALSSFIESDFADGSLRMTSYVRPGKLFTAHSSLMIRRIGQLHNHAFQPIAEAIIRLIQSSIPSS